MGLLNEPKSNPKEEQTLERAKKAILAKNIRYISSLLALPVMFVCFYAIRVLTDGNALSQMKWFTLSIIGTMIVLERLYTYRYAISQRSVLVRDISSTLVNLYVTGAVAGLIFLPVLAFFPEFLFGRNLFFAFSEQLGPFWLQVPVTMLLVSFFRECVPILVGN